MLHELEILIRKGERKEEKRIQRRSDGAPVILGGQLVNEEDFYDDNLC